jgi:hypothetical protein
MQNSSAFQYLAIETVHESASNPRRTFNEIKLQELAESIRQHGLIQPARWRSRFLDRCRSCFPSSQSEEEGRQDNKDAEAHQSRREEGPQPRSRSQTNPKAGPDHRLRALSYEEELHVSVQLQT